MKELKTELEAVKQKEEDLDEKRLLQEGAERIEGNQAGKVS